MADAHTAIIYNADGEIAMIVHIDGEPDAEKKLATDPAFNLPDHTQVRIAREDFLACADDAEIDAKCVEILAKEKTPPKLIEALQAKIEDAIAVGVVTAEMVVAK